jgi:hypothetical protein
MKDLGTLATLVVLALIAAIALVLTNPPEAEQDLPTPEGPPLELYVESILGLPLKDPPIIQRVSQDVLLAEIEENLDEQFGPGGLARRARALELLGFEDLASRSLREEFIALEASGIRGWFNEHKGKILVPNDFDPLKIQDRSLLLGLIARLLVHQHTPTTIGTLADDAWIARRGLHAAIAESVEARFRAEHRAAFDVPTSRQTEREALILNLPTYLHPIGGLPLEKGEARIYLESRVKTGARSLPDLIQEPIESTLELLGGDPSSVSPPRLPKESASTPNQSLLEESLGSLAVQTLVEWLDSYEQAQALALLWRGDRYRLFANGTGDHLLWVCRWETPQAAARAAEVFSSRAKRESDPPRAFSVTAHGRITLLANCADETTLKALREAGGALLR